MDMNTCAIYVYYSGKENAHWVENSPVDTMKERCVDVAVTFQAELGAVQELATITVFAVPVLFECVMEVVPAR